MRRIVFLLFSISLLLLVSACAKEQIWIEKIDGTWTLTDKTIGETRVENIDLITLYFDSCNQNQEDRCTGQITVEYAENGNIETAPMEYMISWSKNLFLYFNAESPFQDIIYEIKSLKKNTLVLEYYDRAHNYELVSLTFHRN